jgi:hypothetical protein
MGRTKTESACDLYINPTGVSGGFTFHVFDVLLKSQQALFDFED